MGVLPPPSFSISRRAAGVMLPIALLCLLEPLPVKEDDVEVEVEAGRIVPGVQFPTPLPPRDGVLDVDVEKILDFESPSA